MNVLVAAVMTMRTISRQIDNMAVTNSAFGDDVVSQLLDIGTAAFEYRNFHAVVVVEVHMQRCLR